MASAARAVVDRHEATQDVAERRRLGSHATPEALARALVDVGIDALGRVPARVADPSCGAGAFLLAAADALVARGVDPAEVLRHRLAGCDVDPAAVLAARDALTCWAVDHRVPPADCGAEEAVVVADALAVPGAAWAGRPDLVVGNPPFLAQRTTDTARSTTDRDAARTRFGALGAYTDTSALFLVASLDLLDDGGVVVMIQPQSVLSARDAGPVRRRVLEDAALVSLWGTDRRQFGADVDVCAPVLVRPSRSVRRQQGDDPVVDEQNGRCAALGRAAQRPVSLRWGAGAPVVATAEAPVGDRSWGPLLAACLGVPQVPDPAPGAMLLGDVASSTAGFRDEFYALAAAAREPGERGWSADAPRLVTVGMVDPGALTWGSAPRRLGGRRVVAPRLDRHALHRATPRVATWASRRLVPKVIVATQTRVVEAAVDAAGDCVPVTPAISVEPLVSDGGGRPGPDVWALAAALMAPSVAAREVATHLGSGLSVGAIRWSARAVRDVPLPTDPMWWRRGTEIVRRLDEVADGERPDLLAAMAPTMARAHGLDPDHPVVDWWTGRVLPV